MNELRITLLILGLVIIAAIYFWGTSLTTRKKSPARGSKRRRLLEDESLDLSSMPGELEDEEDFSKALTTLGGLLAEGEGREKARPASVKPPQSKSRSRASSRQDPETADLFTDRGEHSTATAKADQEQIIILYLTTSPGFPYSGSAIRDAAESVGMRFGEMGVFHHYGFKEMQSRESLFCLANMFEPGSFDINQLATFQTRGLAMFMPPSRSVDGGVVFELMLNTAQRLQARLGGELRDEKREPLGMAQIERMRRQIAHERYANRP